MQPEGRGERHAVDQQRLRRAHSPRQGGQHQHRAGDTRMEPAQRHTPHHGAFGSPLPPARHHRPCCDGQCADEHEGHKHEQGIGEQRSPELAVFLEIAVVAHEEEEHEHEGDESRQDAENAAGYTIGRTFHQRAERALYFTMASSRVMPASSISAVRFSILVRMKL